MKQLWNGQGVISTWFFCCCFNRFGEISLNNAKIIPKIRITLPTLNVLLKLSLIFSLYKFEIFFWIAITSFF